MGSIEYGRSPAVTENFQGSPSVSVSLRGGQKRSAGASRGTSISLSPWHGMLVSDHTHLNFTRQIQWKYLSQANKDAMNCEICYEGERRDVIEIHLEGGAGLVVHDEQQQYYNEMNFAAYGVDSLIEWKWNWASRTKRVPPQFLFKY